MIKFKVFANCCFTDAELKKKKKNRDTEVEAFEDSDDGDGEGREVDYISDSSESEPENTKLEGVSEEKALRYIQHVFLKPKHRDFNIFVDANLKFIEINFSTHKNSCWKVGQNIHLFNGKVNYELLYQSLTHLFMS